jgi:hypothetical protein
MRKVLNSHVISISMLSPVDIIAGKTMNREDFENTLRQYNLSLGEVIVGFPKVCDTRFYRPSYTMWTKGVRVRERQVGNHRRVSIKGRLCMQAHRYWIGDQLHIPDKTTYSISYDGILRS